jgi:cytochrome c-type biogenesis protein CcmH/NrfF
MLLWGLPPAALIAGLVGLMIKGRRQRPTASGTEALSQDEERRLSTLVDGDLPKP